LESKTVQFKSYEFKVPSTNYQGDLRYEDAFKMFAEQMAQNDQSWQQMKSFVVKNMQNENKI
jgi:hypothetical protein